MFLFEDANTRLTICQKIVIFAEFICITKNRHILYVIKHTSKHLNLFIMKKNLIVFGISLLFCLAGFSVSAHSSGNNFFAPDQDTTHKPMHHTTATHHKKAIHKVTSSTTSSTSTSSGNGVSDSTSVTRHKTHKITGKSPAMRSKKIMKTTTSTSSTDTTK